MLKLRSVQLISVSSLFTAAFLYVVCPCWAETTKDVSSQGLSGGSMAYVRVKEYTTKEMENLTPVGSEMKIGFGDAVKLVQKKDDLPMMWLVSKEGEQAWIPAYLLTPNKEEIEFFRQKERIPATMSFIYVKDNKVKVYGIVRLAYLVVDSQGLPASDQGSKQLAFKGNAVIFDDSAVKYKWKNPMVMSNGHKSYKLNSGYMYYCTQVDDTGKGSFDCIDLRTLTFCQN